VADRIIEIDTRSVHGQPFAAPRIASEQLARRDPARAFGRGFASSCTRTLDSVEAMAEERELAVDRPPQRHSDCVAIQSRPSIDMSGASRRSNDNRPFQH
jgi:hypothetical protein